MFIRMVFAAAFMLVALPSLSAGILTVQPGPGTVKDTWVWDSEDFSHGHGGELRANQTSAFDQRILIEFSDLSFVPVGATINSAKLELFRYDGFSGSPVILDAHQILNAWAETVTYSTQPAYGGTLSTQSISADGWYGWDITSLFQSWVNSSVANNGVAIYDHGSGFFQRFQSSDIGGPAVVNGPGAGFTPRLVVDFTTNAVPEPGMLSILGIMALVGFGRSRARKMSFFRK